MEKLYFLFAGIGFAIFGVYLLWSRLALLLDGTRTRGRVVDWETRGRKVYFHPVVAFTAADGREYKFTSYTGYSSRPEIESFPILYRRDCPSHALVYSALHFWGPPFVVLLLAAAPLYLLLKK